MAIYSNGTPVESYDYMMAETSNLKATTAGHIYDLIDTAHDVQQGMNVKVGDYTGDGTELRKSTFPAVGDKIAFACDVPLIYKDDRQADQAAYNYINAKGGAFRAYEVVDDDRFAVTLNGFSETVATGAVTVGNYVTVDGAGKYIEVATAPADTYGWVGKITGTRVGSYGTTMVVIATLRNKQVA